MDRPWLLALVVGTTVVGSVLVAWLGVLAVNAEAWLPGAGLYLGVALVSLLLLVLLRIGFERNGHRSR
ncbi:hypothetical protein [Natrononativus amylolyticus]|uniref:hypothetical protein n=1 Tax=Natrononativus amylolyticus TaxID=2963434 RepID=UPI0020CC4E6B|nr:hypothetical protein [Natrononativus amylolyticus]